MTIFTSAKYNAECFRGLHQGYKRKGGLETIMFAILALKHSVLSGVVKKHHIDLCARLVYSFRVSRSSVYRARAGKQTVDRSVVSKSAI